MTATRSYTRSYTLGISVSEDAPDTFEAADVLLEALCALEGDYLPAWVVSIDGLDPVGS